ncbi:MFS transporter [Knoellia subterranea]|uniref:MFS transporter n=1 Tax=Knoellia subterranea KCTC 19937 TaxID=1385521 RepID=A0A0A0JRL2_9MICO|nr:MFS transporter [Knoellia subterranea]KGN38241.1 MFS transporter [Knoellia subterranea KCTC 19937]
MTDDLALTSDASRDPFIGDPPRRPIHRAWIVAAVTLGALVAAAAFRSSTGVLMEPVEQEFGWSRATTSGAVSLNLIIYGLTAPFAAALMERFGIRRIVTISLIAVGLASAATTFMTSPWHLWLLWGFVIGIGTGSMALVFGAIVANRWFHSHRGLVTGIFSAANATGQLIFLPVIAWAATQHGWRSAAMVVAGLALVIAVLTGLFLSNRPADHGLLPFGAAEGYAVESPEPAAGGSVVVQSPTRLAFSVLGRASRTWTFWALLLTFWVCGWSTNGLIQTHFIPAAHDHGMGTQTAAGLLALVGIFDIAGTIASGWLTDRVDSRILLAIYYGGRGLSLLAIDAVLGPDVQPGLWVFIVFYGLDWVATVPPTVALCRQHFGIEDSGIVFGWVFASHMVGAGVGASIAGWVRTESGSYHSAWLLAAGLCLASVFVALSIPKHRDSTDRETALSR